MKEMEISPDTKKKIDQAVKFASFKDVLIWWWWALTNSKKSDRVVDLIDNGMAFKPALDRVRKECKPPNK